MAGPITVEQLQRCTFGLVLHLNMGSEGHAYEYRCATFPEFRVTRRSLRKPSRVVQRFFVGEQELPTLQAVADALNALWPNRSHRTVAEVDAAAPAAEAS